MTIAFLALADPTFDLAYAQIQAMQAWVALEEAGLPLVGSENLLVDDISVQTAIADCKAANPSMLLIFHASFVSSVFVQEIVSTIQIPLILWGIPEERKGNRLRLNSFSGMNLAANSLKRAGIPYETIYAVPTDKEAIRIVEHYVRAARVVRKLKAAKIAHIGESPAGFANAHYDAGLIRQALGVRIIDLDLESVFKGAREADKSKVLELEANVQHEIQGYNELAHPEESRASLATYLSLSQHVQQYQLQAVALRCWPEFFTEVACAACTAMSLLNNSHIPAACEADVNDSISQLILHWISADASVGMDMVDFDIDDNSAVLWRCGLAPLVMADPDFEISATVHPNYKKPLMLQFPLKPGQVTLARLSEANGELRLIIACGEILKRPLSYTGTSGVIRFENGAEAVMDKILHEGLEKRIALCYGDHVDALTIFARILNLPVLRL